MQKSGSNDDNDFNKVAVHSSRSDGSHYDGSVGRSADDSSSKFGGENAHGYLNPIYTPKNTHHKDFRQIRHSNDKLSDVESQNTVIDRGENAINYLNDTVAVPVNHLSQLRRIGNDGRLEVSQTPDPQRYGAGYSNGQQRWRRAGDNDSNSFVKETYEEKFEEKYSTEEYPDEYSGAQKFFPSS